MTTVEITLSWQTKALNRHYKKIALAVSIFSISWIKVNMQTDVFACKIKVRHIFFCILMYMRVLQIIKKRKNVCENFLCIGCRLDAEMWLLEADECEQWRD